MTSIQPLVSVVTPSYNQAQFLEQTIHSVLEQDYPSIEYIVVDGSSTDGGVGIIRRYAGRLAWWVSEPDSGQAEAINKGLRRASGEIVAWLNSDDVYLPGAVAQAVSALQADPQLGMVYGDAITIDAQGKPLGRFSFGDWGLLDLMGFRIICQPAVFMRRSVLEQAGFLEPSFHFMLDHHLWIRIARLAPIRHIQPLDLESKQPVQGLWAAARHHQGAKNVSQAASFGRETLQVLSWMETQPDLAALIAQNRRRIKGGAYRLNARYLLDEGLAGKALASYGSSLLNRPAFAFKHWHRMLYALLALLGLEKLARPAVDRIASRQRKSLTRLLWGVEIAGAPESEKRSTYRLADWPPLVLHD